MKSIALLSVLLVFGLPFLAITDLFPFHRYGMFARIPENRRQVVHASFEIKQMEKGWEKLKAGNAYFDENYFPLLAENELQNKEKAKELGQKIYSCLSEKPDSIRIVRKENQQNTITNIYP